MQEFNKQVKYYWWLNKVKFEYFIIIFIIISINLKVVRFIINNKENDWI